MYHRILLTNDGSPLAAAAIPYAAALARQDDAEVLVLRVSHAAGDLPERIDGDTWERAIIAAGRVTVALEAEPLLGEVVARLKAAGVERAGSLVLRGEPGPTIAEAARAMGADLVVVSSHGLSGLRRAVLGSVADHVIRHAGNVPVLLCHPLPPDVVTPFERIVVPLDGSPFAEAALQHAADIARSAGSTLILVRGIDSVARVIAASMPVAAGVAVPGLSNQEAEEIVAAERGAIREELALVAARLATEGVPHTRIEIVEDLPSDAILQTAKRHDCRLVVMSTHGRGGLGRTLLGSVADEVTRHLDAGAVLLVHP